MFFPKKTGLCSSERVFGKFLHKNLQSSGNIDFNLMLNRWLQKIVALKKVTLETNTIPR
jgi:hypothetical protein